MERKRERKRKEGRKDGRKFVSMISSRRQGFD